MSSMYKTQQPFAASAYDPTYSSLINGLSSMASYDPSTQTTPLPSSAAQYLSGGNDSSQQQQRGGTEQTAPAASTSTTAAVAAQPTSGLLASSASQPATYASYRSNLAAASPSQVGPTDAFTGFIAPPSAPAAAASNTAGNAASNALTNNVAGTPSDPAFAAAQKNTPYGGAQYVTIQDAANRSGLYQWNSQQGTYSYVGTRDPYGRWVDLNTGKPVNVDAAAAQQATPVNGRTTTPSQGAQLATQANQAYVNKWNQDTQSAYQQTVAQQSAAAAQAQQQSYLDYMLAHNGAAMPVVAQGNQTIAQASAAAAAAQQQYQAYQQNAATLGAGMTPVDTSSVQATNRAAQNALTSQSANFLGGADAGMASQLGQNYNASLSGQGNISVEKAAATQYQASLANFAQQLSNRNTMDSNAASQQLQLDMQHMADTIDQLKQNVGQLGTTKGQAVQTAVDNLNQLINNYQYAVQHYGAASQQAMQIAGFALSTGASIATGGASALA